MIIVAAVALMVISVPLAGGNLGALSTLRVHAAWAAVTAVALQVVIISIFQRVIPHALASGLHLVSYALAAWFVFANRHIRWLWVVALGGALNLVAIAANDGVMPASAAAMRAAGIATVNDEFVNSGAVAHARFAFFGDVFAVPRSLPLANVFSIGDVLLVVGVGLVLHAACGSRLGCSRISRATRAEHTS